MGIKESFDPFLDARVPFPKTCAILKINKSFKIRQRLRRLGFQYILLEY